MVTWKVVLIVIAVAALAMAVGMWFGYQYVSEKEDIPAEGWHLPPDTTPPHYDQPRLFLPVRARVPIAS